jgi:hypothetical protein
MTTFLKHADTHVPGARTLPGHSFTSPDIYAEELEKIFYRSWLCVGRAIRFHSAATIFGKPSAARASSSCAIGRSIARLLQCLPASRHAFCEAARGRLNETIHVVSRLTYTLDG